MTKSTAQVQRKLSSFLGSDFSLGFIFYKYGFSTWMQEHIILKASNHMKKEMLFFPPYSDNFSKFSLEDADWLNFGSMSTFADGEPSDW